MEALINHPDMRRLAKATMSNPEFGKLIKNVVSDPSMLTSALQMAKNPGALDHLVGALAPTFESANTREIKIPVKLTPREVYFGCIKSVEITPQAYCRVRFPRGVPDGYQITLQNVKELGDVNVNLTATMDTSVFTRRPDAESCSDVETETLISLKDALGPCHLLDLPSMSVLVACKQPVFGPQTSVRIVGGGLPKYNGAFSADVSDFAVNFVNGANGTLIEIAARYPDSDEDFVHYSNARTLCGDAYVRYRIDTTHLDAGTWAQLARVLQSSYSLLDAPALDLPRVIIEHVK